MNSSQLRQSLFIYLRHVSLLLKRGTNWKKQKAKRTPVWVGRGLLHKYGETKKKSGEARYQPKKDLITLPVGGRDAKYKLLFTVCSRC